MADLIYAPLSRPSRPKGPRAKDRAKRRRADSAYALKVRADVDERDGYCRFTGLTRCAERSEWAHLEDKKRARTRGMEPEERHTTAKSLKACAHHHRLYDAGKIQIAMTERGADGPIRAQLGERVIVC